jgi:hypothetical protein
MGCTGHTFYSKVSDGEVVMVEKVCLMYQGNDGGAFAIMDLSADMLMLRPYDHIIFDMTAKVMASIKSGDIHRIIDEHKAVKLYVMQEVIDIGGNNG